MEREILNHRFLMHPHIVQFKEVRAPSAVHCQLHMPVHSLLQSSGVHFFGSKSMKYCTSPAVKLAMLAGILDIEIPGHCHGICSRRGHVRVCCAERGLEGE